MVISFLAIKILFAFAVWTLAQTITFNRLLAVVLLEAQLLIPLMHTLIFINVLYILQVVVFILIITKRVYPVARACSDMYFNNEALSSYALMQTNPVVVFKSLFCSIIIIYIYIFFFDFLHARRVENLLMLESIGEIGHDILSDITGSNNNLAANAI